MNIERKFIDLKQLKVSDDGPGIIEGYRSVFNVIDEGGDLIVPGAFKDCIPEFLESGFTAHSHDWDFDKAVGYPIEAREDDHGWFVKSQFHSTPDAQTVRTKARERMEAGKKVGFSFGYSPTEFSHIESKDYETELAKYVKAENLQETLTKAQKFNRIRILKKVDAIEDSLVTAPMNKRAAATAVKDSVHIFVHGEPGPGAVINAAMKSECDCLPESGDDCPHTSNSNLKEMPGTDSFESFESVEAVLKKFTENMQRNHDNRVKEGRVLSGSNRAKVIAARDALDDLLSASEPREKIDVIAMRAQSDRIRNRLLRERT